MPSITWNQLLYPRLCMCLASKASKLGLLLSGVGWGLCLRHCIAQNGVYTFSQVSVALLKATVPNVKIKTKTSQPVSVDQSPKTRHLVDSARGWVMLLVYILFHFTTFRWCTCCSSEARILPPYPSGKYTHPRPSIFPREGLSDTKWKCLSLAFQSKQKTP